MNAINTRLASPTRYVLNRLIGPLIKKYCPEADANILDIGCGNGYYDFFIKEKIKGKYLGIDAEHSDIWNTTQSPINGLEIFFKNHDAERLDSLDGMYNFICAFQSFEHIHDNNRALSGMRQKVHKNGFMLLTVPSTYSFCLYGFHGFRRYSRVSLVKLANAHNLTLEYLGKIGGLGTFMLHFILWTVPSFHGYIHIWKYYKLLRLSKCIGWLENTAMKLDTLLPIFESGYVVVLRK